MTKERSESEFPIYTKARGEHKVFSKIYQALENPDYNSTKIKNLVDNTIVRTILSGKVSKILAAERPLTFISIKLQEGLTEEEREAMRNDSDSLLSNVHTHLDRLGIALTVQR